MAVELIAGEKENGESNKAITACNDYLRMGVGRSLAKLCDRYRNATEQIPTRRIATLKTWSVDYGWQDRADAYDKAVDAEKTAAVEARRNAIMEQGLSQDYERVNELYELFEKLKFEFVTRGLWYTDIKLSATGDKVEVEVFNKALLDSMRGALDDLAKETGGRKQKSEVKSEIDVNVDDATERLFGRIGQLAARIRTDGDAEGIGPDRAGEGAT